MFLLRPVARGLAASACVLALSLALSAQAAGPTPTSGIDSPPDHSVRAQDDFFRHVNGQWLKDTPIPADRPSIGAFEQIHEAIQPQLRELIETAAKAPRDARDAEARKLGDLYASFMDEAAVEKLGAAPVVADIAAIEAVTDARQLAPLMARFLRAGIAMPLALDIHQDAKDSTRYVADISQSGLGLPDRDYYLQDADAKFKQTRQAYAVYLSRILTLAGERDTDAAAQAILTLETELARVQWTRVELRDPVKAYNRVELAALPQLAPGLDWDALLGGTGVAGKVGYLVVGQPSYVTGLAGLQGKLPLASWKAYLKSRVLGAYAPFLGKQFVDTRFAFFGTALRGTPENQPRWKRGVALVQASVGDGLGKLYVAKYFPPEHKARMEKLVANLLDAYRRSIDTLTWMGPATKKEAQAKLAKFSPKIGYPKRWIDYSRLEIKADNLVGNVRRAREFEFDRQIAKLGRPIDRDEWLMTPQVVNAYYNPEMNEIVFPAAILQPPFFNVKADDAVNYGGIGAVIGHEISHGFDDQGSQYDGDGNLRDWWTKDDRARFNALGKMLVKQYGEFKPLPGYSINGELTLGENIADNSGLAIAYKAYRLSLKGKPAPVIGGMSGDARFFSGFAQVWRGKIRDETLLERLKSDPHSPDEFRANGAVRNHPEFYRQFKLKPGDGLYLPPAERVLMW